MKKRKYSTVLDEIAQEDQIQAIDSPQALSKPSSIYSLLNDSPDKPAVAPSSFEPSSIRTPPPLVEAKSTSPVQTHRTPAHVTTVSNVNSITYRSRLLPSRLA